MTFTKNWEANGELYPPTNGLIIKWVSGVITLLKELISPFQDLLC